MTWLREVIKLEKGNLSRIKKTNLKQLDSVIVDFWKLIHHLEQGVEENIEEHIYFVSNTCLSLGRCKHCRKTELKWLDRSNEIHMKLFYIY